MGLSRFVDEAFWWSVCTQDHRGSTRKATSIGLGFISLIDFTQVVQPSSLPGVFAP